ncbi:hypothetical protein HY634_04615 [Candidatus Uhrbacteria bacterium]|nr:hypothetical protein [Candidatus Uhrbacteria bacterium]
MHQSKIEQAQEKVEQLRQDLRTQVEEEVRSSIRKRTWRQFLLRGIGCCGIYLVLLLSIPTLLLYLVARTGLVDIPWLSARVAHERAPERMVAAAAAGNVEQLLAAKLRAVVVPGGSSIPPLTFSEEELTSLLRMVLTERNASSFGQQAATAQVAIDRGAVELSGRIPGLGGAVTTVRVRGVPFIRDGRLAVEVSDVVVGNLGIPRFLAQTIARSLIDQVPPARIALDGGMPAIVIDRITLQDHELTVYGTPAR